MTQSDEERAREITREILEGPCNADCREEIFSVVFSALKAKEREVLEKVIKIPQEWIDSSFCQGHDDNPCCHVRLATEIKSRIEKLEDAAFTRMKESMK